MWRKVDIMSIVYLEFLWRNYHCLFRGCIACYVLRLENVLRFVLALWKMMSTSTTVSDQYV